jgi:hypothetical protein
MMKTLIKAAVAATVATGLFAAPAFAAPNTDKATFSAHAKIVKAVTLKNNFDLDFGTITMMSGLVKETVKVELNDTRVCGDGSNLGVTCSFPPQALATFTVTGVPSQDLDLVITGDTQLTDAANNKVDFRPLAPTTVSIPVGGTVDFAVGGEIDIYAATKDGVYKGNLLATVTYK